MKKTELVPEICKPIEICTMPDLKELNGDSPKDQQIVDHGIIQAANGKWQLWACLRGVKIGRLLYGWEGDSLTSENWRHAGVKMRSSAEHYEGFPAEGIEQIGAPFFIKEKDEYFCFYHSDGIRVAKSTDGVNYERPKYNGTAISGGRDVAIMKHDGLFYSYVTTTAKTSENKLISYVESAVSSDLESWSSSKIVSKGGKGGSGPVDAESPFVVFVEGYFYLFRTSSISFKTVVYRSEDPQDFGIDDDSKLIAELDFKIPELLQFDNKWYVTHISNNFQSVLLSEINWKE